MQLHLRRLLLLLFLLVAPRNGYGLKVVIDYSFHLPEKLGVATPESANCCPYGQLPDNNTHGMVPPTVIGIGVQKGGTTTLYAHFLKHKQLYGAKKELHYLDGGGQESYKSYLKKWGYNRRSPRTEVTVNNTTQLAISPPAVGGLYEISPSYMFVPFAACKAKVISPNAKFVVFLRDPADRAHSGLTYTAHLMGHRFGYKYKWMHRSFWSLARQGIAEIAHNPTCNFQTGSGKYTYNDCMGCMLRKMSVQSRCAQRPFVTVTNAQGNFKCNFVGKEHVLRGMYGAQLAWWFTLFHPSQFKIINSKRFFKNPLEVMQEIGTFLDLHPPYTKWMLDHSAKKANVGHYRKEDAAMLKVALEVLKEFYRRPNLELYRLLHDTGHFNFEPFEDNLQGMDILNCTDSEVASSGVCGDLRFLNKDSNLSAMNDTLPEVVHKAVFPISPERPEMDSQAVMQETEGDSSLNEKEEGIKRVVPVLSTQDPEALAISNTEPNPEESPSVKTADDSNKAVATEPQTHKVAPVEKPSEPKEMKHEVAEGMVVEEVDVVSHISVTRPSSFRSQVPFDHEDGHYHDRGSQPGIRVATMSNADFSIHILFATFLLFFVWYGWRSVRIRRR